MWFEITNISKQKMIEKKNKHLPIFFIQIHTINVDDVFNPSPFSYETL